MCLTKFFQGNIGRYLNHSCDPNVFVQNVFVESHDLRFESGSKISQKVHMKINQFTSKVSDHSLLHL